MAGGGAGCGSRVGARGGPGRVRRARRDAARWGLRRRGVLASGQAKHRECSDGRDHGRSNDRSASGGCHGVPFVIGTHCHPGRCVLRRRGAHGRHDRIGSRDPSPTLLPFLAIVTAELGRRGATPPAPLTLADVALERPKNRDHGDWASNTAMKLAKPSGEPARVRRRDRRGARGGRRRRKRRGRRARIHQHPAGCCGRRRPREDDRRAGRGLRRNDACAATRSTSSSCAQTPPGRCTSATPAGRRSATPSPGCLQARARMVTREFYINDAGEQMDRFGRCLLAALHGEPTPEGGYAGAVHRRPRAPGRRRARPGHPRRCRARTRRMSTARIRPTTAARRDPGIACTSSTSTSTSGSRNDAARESRRRSTRPSTGCARRVTSSTRTARSGCARPTSATTRTASSAAQRRLHLLRRRRRLLPEQGRPRLRAQDLPARRRPPRLRAPPQGARRRRRRRPGGGHRGADRPAGSSINGGVRLSKRAGNIIEMDDLREWLGTDALRYSLGALPGRLAAHARPRAAAQAHQRQPGLLRAVRPRPHAQRRRATPRHPASTAARSRPSCSPTRPRATCSACCRSSPASSPWPPRCASRTASRATSRSSPALYHRWYDNCRVTPLGDEAVTTCTAPGSGSTTPPVRCCATASTCSASARRRGCDRWRGRPEPARPWTIAVASRAPRAKRRRSWPWIGRGVARARSRSAPGSPTRRSRAASSPRDPRQGPQPLALPAEQEIDVDGRGTPSCRSCSPGSSTSIDVGVRRLALGALTGYVDVTAEGHPHRGGQADRPHATIVLTSTSAGAR